MKFGKTLAEERIDLRKKDLYYEQYRPFFAWYPVQITEGLEAGQYRWLEYVETKRRRNTYYNYYVNDYRVI